ncbi:ATP-dependent protease ATPase subunit HslU [Reichenbachiella ulvae]|uniref:ATP-dependent protease ATPase subunit HslU n=1 Tax=Reichenbachiella ulvae TaxID=2980104 RepID=A0ABT3CTC8_9BACT|nr:ATP-dependent protease ATPase subunit HslU [Reichenbachiella ulvae]MCV9386730.1 ATP-dependent protease ATPase subunit HslU [Reichenbachiella ulvae]
MLSKDQYLTPKEIVSELDKYIIGQKDAKRNVAIALRNRWRRMNVKTDIQGEIVPNNILMIGATGVGKTEIARRLAKIADAPFVKVEASKFTEVGYVGRDVESMVRDLVEQSVSLVKQAKKEAVKEKAEEIVEGIILDALIPPVRKATPSATVVDSNSTIVDDEELNEKTRERFREKIRNRELEDRKIDISVKQNSTPGVGMIGGGQMDESSMMNIQEMIGNMMPKKTKKRKVTIEDARKLLMEEESSRLIDMDEVKDEAIAKAENTGIIFIDEVDKIAVGASKKGGPDVSREGVQRDLLPIVEGSAVNTKYGVINTDHILFIAAGAFHFAKPSDLIPELQGRFPIRVELENLTQADFIRILNEPKNALTKQYAALIGAEDVQISFSPEAVEEIASIAFEINAEIENIGARRLHTVMSRLLNDILFDIPDVIGPNANILIDREMVQEKLSGMVENRDLSQFIL